MKNYILKNHLSFIIIITIIGCTIFVTNYVDYQSWRLCQGLNIGFTELLPKEKSDEIFIQSCSRDRLMKYLIKTPNSTDIDR